MEQMILTSLMVFMPFNAVLLLIRLWSPQRNSSDGRDADSVVHRSGTLPKVLQLERHRIEQLLACKVRSNE